MASLVYFSNNPSDWDDVEGLYISEENPPGSIVGVNLNTTGIGGITVRGPTTPQLITNPDRFKEVYGGRDYGQGGTLINEVWRSMLNKKFGPIVVRRVAASGATAGTKTLSNGVPTVIATVSASSVGAWSLAANVGPTVAVEAATNADANMWNLKVSYQGKIFLYENLNTQTGFDNLAATIGTDFGTLITVIKNVDGRPVNSAAAALTGGSDGSVASADYIAAVTDLAAYDGVSIVMMAGASVSQSALNGTIVTLAAASNDRVFPTWSGVHGAAVSADIASEAAQITTRSDRIIWCYNSAKTLDPTTGTQIDCPASEFMASVLCQTFVDVHPGDSDNNKYLAGVASLRNEALSRGDLVALRAAGISTLEKLSGSFSFRSGVTTSLTSGKTEITRRRCADFLQLSAAARIQGYVKKRGTQLNRTGIKGEILAFCTQLQADERIIDADDKVLGPGFSISERSTAAERGQGLFKFMWQCRFMGNMLYVVLQTQFGTGVTVTVQEA